MAVSAASPMPRSVPVGPVFGLMVPCSARITNVVAATPVAVPAIWVFVRVWYRFVLRSSFWRVSMSPKKYVLAIMTVMEVSMYWVAAMKATAENMTVTERRPGCVVSCFIECDHIRGWVMRFLWRVSRYVVWVMVRARRW